ncbi:toxin-antitoxin system YwqK family antitoxin [Ancylobacter sp. IITR112]|uniref:toxin-antitoxin system YwqK family antitoxin n=1 Tax=Ancylobacter sp. IITR112 TaxID=3138073 RepID=UPI00352A6827
MTSPPVPFAKTHRDGSLWSRGQTVDGVPVGEWEWFRKDGTRLRSGTFDKGRQVGEWTTYDREGNVYKVTRMKESGSGRL